MSEETRQQFERARDGYQTKATYINGGNTVIVGIYPNTITASHMTKVEPAVSFSIPLLGKVTLIKEVLKEHWEVIGSGNYQEFSMNRPFRGESIEAIARSLADQAAYRDCGLI